MTTKTLKDKDLQEHYEDVFAMHGTPGWARLQEDLAVAIADKNSLAEVETVEQLWFRKGQLDQMIWLQMHQAMHETAYNELLAEQEGGDAEPSTGGKAKVVG